ncbi:hypothetical protein GGP72_003130 [Salinibacter ruber]|jgi:hypothetical protein|uniref:Uncharacterized protein n=1 Tax=Salinibacter ruber TaxID=146919 RepID=A0A9X2TD80_9BACT|nr:hypothetical protein [Salinibacter ruber]MCS3682468.1 hypothetical protein [Salinibacter ruber]
MIRTVQQEASDIWYRPMLTSRTYDRAGIRVEQPKQIQPGLTFITALWNDPRGAATGLQPD